MGHHSIEGGKIMAINNSTLFSTCPVCAAQAGMENVAGYQCDHCGLSLKPQKHLWPFKAKEVKYLVQAIGQGFDIVATGLIGQTFSAAEVKNFRESVYSDQVLAEFAEAKLDNLNMPASTLAQILLEQLRETCYIQINNLRRAHGPIISGQSSRIPTGKVPTVGLTWQDKGNLFLTNIRLVFPSNSFTFIRLDRKVTGLQTYENGLAVQRKGEAFATYFVGGRAHQTALTAAYIFGKIPHLRRQVVA